MGNSRRRKRAFAQKTRVRLDVPEVSEVHEPLPRMKMLIASGSADGWSLPREELDVRHCGASPSAIAEALTLDTEVLVTDALPADLDRAGGVKWLHLMSAGYNQVIGHPLALKNGVRVSNSAGLCAGHMAEFVVGQMLRDVKRFDDYGPEQADRRWPNRAAMATPALRGRHGLIVGYGGVGRETARILRALGVTVDAVQRQIDREVYRGYLRDAAMGDPDGSIPKEIFTLAQMEAAVARADFVILTVPLTKETKLLINESTLKAMKPGAVLINVARGGLIEFNALSAALTSRRLKHAYLDVFDREPLPSDSPMWGHLHLTITPHMSGVMPDAVHLQQDLLRHNLQRYLGGGRLLNEITPANLSA